ncbi:MAG TPA: SIMPL domain-containing protein [Alphaproteobacteria bacterium]|jgi:uncharacterized protein YggE|nr:SIMPL domain-containing protein [Alphaproteobacteria bacterium]
MKAFGLVFTFFILLFIFAKWGPAINFNTTMHAVNEPFVVSGEGKVSVTPDIAKITVGIQQSGNSLKLVQNDVNAKSKNLTDAIKKLGIAESDIKTTSYNVYPQYDYTNPNSKITGYQVSTDYEITIKDFDKVNDVIVAATTSGANIVGNVNFEVNDKTHEQKLQEAREIAVKEAKEKAEGLAKSAGITLGKIINISENQNGQIRPVMLDKMSAEGSAPTAPNIQPGTTDINVVVSLSYEVR